MYGVELVERKDQPVEKSPPEFENRGGKTVGLLLRISKSLWHTGKFVVLDSGFYVLNGLVELKKVGVYAAALIKKRQYWPKHIDGDAFKSHFDDKPIGHCDAKQGT